MKACPSPASDRPISSASDVMTLLASVLPSTLQLPPHPPKRSVPEDRSPVIPHYRGQGAGQGLPGRGRGLHRRSWIPAPQDSRKEPGAMSDTLTYQRMGMAGRGRAHALFAQTMGYVAATAALF